MRKPFLVLSAAALLALPEHASAWSTLFTASANWQMTPGGGSSYDTTDGHFRGPAHGNWTVGGFQTAKDTYWSTNNRFSAADFWFSGRLYQNTSGQAGDAQNWFGFLSADGVARLFWRAPSSYRTNGNSDVYKNDSGGTNTSLGTMSCPFNAPSTVPDKVDIHIKYSTSGSINVYVNGTPCFSYAGDITTNSTTAITGFWVGSTEWDSGGWADWSEVLVADGDTRSLGGLAARLVTGAGTNQAWSCTGSTSYGSVNANPNTDATFCATPTNGAAEGFGFDSTQPTLTSGVWLPLAANVSVRALVGGSGPQHIAPMLRIGSTNYTGTAFAPGSALDRYQYSWSNSPATSLPFTATELFGAQFGVVAAP